MKKTKQILSLILAVIMCIALASCTQAINFDIKSNEACSLKYKITASETELDKIETISSSMDFIQGIITGDMGSIDNTQEITETIKLFKEQSDKQGLTEEIDGVKYYSIIDDLGIKNIKEANEFFGNEGKATTKELWLYASKDEMDSIFSAYNQYSKFGIEFQAVMNVKMPYTIAKTNGTKVDDYTVQFDLQKDNVYYITTTASTAEWTKSTDLRKTVIDMAKKNCTPSKVTGVKVVYKTTSSLKVNWSEQYGNITGYKIERKIGTGSWKTLKTVKSENVKYDVNLNPYILDKNLKINKKYSYRVRAYYKTSDFTVFGNYSKVKAVTFANLKTKPSIKVTALNNAAKVTVKKKTKNITGYEIKYSKSSSFKGAKTVTTKSLSKTIKKLSDGKKYYFKVRKYCNSTGTKVYSAWSNKVSVTIK